MLYSIKNREDLGKLEELALLQNQVEEVRLQDKLGKQNFHEILKKVVEPVTDKSINTTESITKIVTDIFINNNNALENLNDKLLEIMNERDIIAPCLLSSLSKTTNPGNTTHFKLIKDSNSNRVHDLLTHNTIPVTFYDNLLTFRDRGKIFELKGDLLKIITNRNYNIDVASLSDKKLLYDFAKDLNAEVKAQGKKSNRDRTLIKLLKSQSLMISASRISNTIFLSSDPNELCNRINLLLQEKQAGNNSEITNDEIVAIVDKLLEDQCISKKEHKQNSNKFNLINPKKYI